MLAGFDYAREAPRQDDLDQYAFFNPSNPAYYGLFTPVDGNNVTIGSLTPYIAAEGALSHYFRYYLGWRRDEIGVDNDDLLHLAEFVSEMGGSEFAKSNCVVSAQGIVVCSA